MRARDTVFHVPCFSCTVCAVALTKGDQFGMRDGAVFCQHHYQQFVGTPVQHQQPLSSSPPPPQPPPPSSSSVLPLSQLQRTVQPSMASAMSVQSPYPSNRSLGSPGPGAGGVVQFFNGSAAAAAVVGNNGPASLPASAHQQQQQQQQQPRQKGRPRKRKPKDLDAMTANMGKYSYR